MEIIMKKLAFAAALGLPLVTAGFASAGGPVPLTDRQMDAVSAGGISAVLVEQIALASGTNVAATSVKAAAFTAPIAQVTAGSTVVTLELNGAVASTTAQN
jgi:hypothetical protein